jgi:gliding motility-associated peptidyl-prolyl isomerase
MKRISCLVFILIVFISCDNPIARKPVTYSSNSFLNESIKRNIKVNALQESMIKHYISQDSISNYITSPYGFWYKYNNQINIEKRQPIAGDEVEFEYEISNLLNETIYSINTLGKNIHIIDKEDAEIGIQNGLKLMKEGEEVVFLFPSFAAFGYSGNKEKIGVNQPLIYKVKLNKINKRK